MSDSSPRQRKLKIEVPNDLRAQYANFAMITHTGSEFLIDFAHLVPNAPQAQVKDRIVMSPTHVKLLLQALQENVEKYEERFGEIGLPDEGERLARQFFGGVKPPDAS